MRTATTPCPLNISEPRVRERRRGTSLSFPSLRRKTVFHAPCSPRIPPRAQVFRFDQSIAHVANSLVGPLKGETRPLLGCAGKQGEVSGVLCCVVVRCGSEREKAEKACTILVSSYASTLLSRWRRRVQKAPPPPPPVPTRLRLSVYVTIRSASRFARICHARACLRNHGKYSAGTPVVAAFRARRCFFLVAVRCDPELRSTAKPVETPLRPPFLTLPLCSKTSVRARGRKKLGTPDATAKKPNSCFLVCGCVA